MASVLCIDDSDVTLRLRKLLLETVGYTVVTANSGEQGISVFRLAHFDLVLCDFYLPGETGAEIAARIKAIRPNTPFVLVSGSIELPALVPHVDACFTKGDSPESLITLVSTLLARPKPSLKPADEPPLAAAAAC